MCWWSQIQQIYEGEMQWEDEHFSDKIVILREKLMCYVEALQLSYSIIVG